MKRFLIRFSQIAIILFGVSIIAVLFYIWLQGSAAISGYLFTGFFVTTGLTVLSIIAMLVGECYEIYKEKSIRRNLREAILQVIFIFVLVWLTDIFILKHDARYLKYIISAVCVTLTSISIRYWKRKE